MAICLAGFPLAPPVLLAPMSGITDLPFRQLVSGFGAGLVVSEMVASGDMVRGRLQARERAEHGLGNAASAVQLVGREPRWMAEAARRLEQQGVAVIDINMGCPARKVTSASGAGAAGSGLLREPALALRLIEAVVGAVSVPVTMKTRLGWDETLMNAPDIAAAAERAGVAMVTIRGRTRCQFYSGAADWAAIRRVRDAVSIPVVANGDIVDTPTARAALAASGADGVMVGRAAEGRPWRLAEIAHALNGAPAPGIPAGPALADLVGAHHEAMLAFHGADRGVRIARKHLGWYLDAAVADRRVHADAARAARGPLLTADAPGEVRRLIRTAFAAPVREAA